MLNSPYCDADHCRYRSHYLSVLSVMVVETFLSDTLVERAWRDVEGMHGDPKKKR